MLLSDLHPRKICSDAACLRLVDEPAASAAQRSGNSSSL
jgi:hypothetical protein